MATVAAFVATAGYVGFVPIAPGTFGSAVGLILYAGIRLAGSAPLELLTMMVALALGIWSAERLERELGKDPSAVVIDEVTGMLVTLAFLEVTVTGAIVGFLIFRVLDVIKPYPAGRLEHLHGGPGIMLDDVVAGIYSNLLLRAAMVLAPGVFA